MKFTSYLILCLGLTTQALASWTPAQSQERLNELQKHRTGTTWTCKKGDNAEALVIFSIDLSAQSMVSNSRVLAIQDEQMCSALQVTCPFVAGPDDYYPIGSAKYHFRATQGKYEDTIQFRSDGEGMKIESIYNGSQPYVMADKNWYFGPGECVLH